VLSLAWFNVSVTQIKRPKNAKRWPQKKKTKTKTKKQTVMCDVWFVIYKQYTKKAGKKIKIIKNYI